MSERPPTPSRTAFRSGARKSLALSIGVFPFGAVFGVAVAQSTVNPVVGASSSLLVFAGAAQLSMIDLYEGGATWLVVVGTALAINARFVLYSAALAPAFSEFPSAWRVGLPHLMTDQAATLSLIEYAEMRDPAARRWFYLGAAAALCTSWQIGTTLGVVLGAQVPDAWQLGFIIPLMFTALVVPSLNRRPAVVAAVVSTAITIAGAGLPPGTNIIVGALTGIAAGAVDDRFLQRPGGTAHTAGTSTAEDDE